jgi:large subunit ribosomal protein L7/L12
MTEDKTTDAAAEAVAEEVKEVPAEYKEMIEKIEGMTVLELNGLVKAIEERFGVSAAAVAVAGGGDAGAGAAEEKSEFDVKLVSFGEKKIAVIKAIKTILGLGLKEAKDMVEAAPTDIKSGVKKEEAEEWKATLEEAGATVELA